MHVLIMPVLHGFGYQRNQFFIHREVGKTLAQVDGIVLNRQGAHYGKNGSACRGQFALYGCDQEM